MAKKPFVVLDAEILSSSVWSEAAHVRLVWITLLILCDTEGYVGAAVPGIATAAGVSLELAEEAIERLQQPDRHSRTQTNEGRRLEKVERGWRVLNFLDHLDRLSSERKKARDRVWRHRQRKRQETTVTLQSPQGVGSRDQGIGNREQGRTEERTTAPPSAVRPETAIKALEDAGKALAEMTAKKVHDPERAALVAEVNGLLREISFLGGGDGQQELRAASKFPGKAGLVRTDTAPLPWLRVARDRLLERKMGLQEQQAQGVQAQAPYPWEPEGIAAQDKAKAEIMARVKR